MANQRFSSMKESDERISAAPLKHAAETNEKPKGKKYTVYDIPEEWIKAIKSEGIGVATYARMAIVEKLRRDGKI